VSLQLINNSEQAHDSFKTFKKQYITMKKHNIFLMMVLVFGMQACQNQDRKRDDASTTAADSTLDTTQRAQMSTADVDMDGDAKAFILPAIAGGMLEIEAGNLMVQKSANAEVKAFAAMMVKDHTKANQDLEKIAKGKGLAVPTTLPEEQFKNLNTLRELSGRDLDVRYMTMMISAHDQTQTLFTKASMNENGDLKQYALNTLPVIQTHYKQAVKLGQKLNISNVNNGDNLSNVDPDEKSLKH